MNYPFWKFRIKIFVESINKGIWHAVVNSYAIPTQVVDDKTTNVSFESWPVKEIRRAKYDSKAMNIIYSSLNCDEFFMVSAYTMTKEMWDLIQVPLECTPEVRRAMKYSLIQEYETFWMQQGETI